MSGGAGAAGLRWLFTTQRVVGRRPPPGRRPERPRERARPRPPIRTERTVTIKQRILFPCKSTKLTQGAEAKGPVLGGDSHVLHSSPTDPDGAEPCSGGCPTTHEDHTRSFKSRHSGVTHPRSSRRLRGAHVSASLALEGAALTRLGTGAPIPGEVTVVTAPDDVSAGQAGAPARHHPLVERARRGDLWEGAADERERLADERESVADEREWLADERDRLIDQREHELDRLARALADQGVDAQAELAAVRAAVRRAEPGLGRAAEELARVRQAAARTEARALRGRAARDRGAAARGLEGVEDREEQAWLLDRRDFVAAERDRLADEREGSADRRDLGADAREDLADDRERELLEREQILRTGQAPGGRAGVLRLTPGADRSGAMTRRAGERDRRTRAAEGRHEATRDRRAAAAHWGPQPYGPQLVASFAELALRLFGAEDPALALAQVLDYAVAAVPGCDGAALTLWRHTSVFDSLATSPAGATLDNIQYVNGEGPAFQAMTDGTPVHVPDLAHDPRWPALAAAAASLGVGEVLCYGLVVQGERTGSALGSLTLSSATEGAFGEDELEFGTLLSSYLAVAVATVQRGADIDRREAALHRALSTRDVIGQAKGILMERQGLSAPEAFDVLRRASQRLNLRLTDIAERLAQTGRLPTQSGTPSSSRDAPEPRPSGR